MNRICPQEEKLAEYISGLLSGEELVSMEEHLDRCDSCRKLAFEAHEVITRPDPGRISRRFFGYMRKNLWMAAAAVFFLCSFIFRGHFLQFLALTVISALKWIIDSRNTRLLVMIHDAWKRGDKEKTEHILSRIDPEE
jgi:hypothetical protein